MQQITNFEDFDGYATRERTQRLRQKPSPRCDCDEKTSRWSRIGDPVTGHRKRPESPSEIQFGDVLQIPDKILGFENLGSIGLNHPSICIEETTEEVIEFIHGTDSSKLNLRYRGQYVYFASSECSGLSKPTAFKIWPSSLRFQQVRLLYPERHMGQCDKEERNRLRNLIDSVLEAQQ